MNKLNYTGQKLNFRWMNTANWISYLTWVGSSLVGALLGILLLIRKVWFGFRHRRYVYRVTLSSSHF
jgi:predicted branched-subunit amino acid permease